MFSTELSERDFRRLSALVYKNCGINLHQGKKALVRSRLGKRLRETGLKDFNAYYKYVTQEYSGAELVRMLDAISTNLTSFFREEEHFDFMKQEVFPTYASGNNRKSIRRLRFWSAGCSTGEEPFSLAISLLEYFRKSQLFNVKILATDISTRALSQAKKGVYPAIGLEKLSESMARKYFLRGYGKHKGYFKAKPSLMAMVEFKRFNLMEPFPFKEAFDLILCRNVMIYFDKRTQQVLVNKLYNTLHEGGYLFVGHSESLTGTDHSFNYIRPSVYQKPHKEACVAQ